MSTADYIDRRFDILALQGATAAGKVQLKQQLFEPGSGEICTGVQKLAQRWVLEFLTIRGSVTFQPLRGTNFMAIARRGGFRNEVDVIAEFNFAAVDVRRTLLNEQVDAMQDDERLERADLTNVAISAGQLLLTITITSQAGTSRKAILPIPTLPIRTGV